MRSDVTRALSQLKIELISFVKSKGSKYGSKTSRLRLLDQVDEFGTFYVFRLWSIIAETKEKCCRFVRKGCGA